MVREKSQVTYKGRAIRIILNFSTETLKARRSWTDTMQPLKIHRCQPRLPHPVKLSITIDGENKIFQDKSQFKQYLSTNPVLQKMLERKLQLNKDKDNYIHENTRKSKIIPYQ